MLRRNRLLVFQLVWTRITTESANAGELTTHDVWRMFAYGPRLTVRICEPVLRVTLPPLSGVLAKPALDYSERTEVVFTQRHHSSADTLLRSRCSMFLGIVTIEMLTPYRLKDGCDLQPRGTY